MSLRVLHATPSFAPAYRIGGPVRSLEGLVRELSNLDVRVRVLTTDSNGDRRLDVPRGWTTHRGIPVRYLPRWLPPSETPLFAWASYIEAKRADLVHITGLFAMPSMQALLAARLANKPVVLSPRGVLEGAALEMGRKAQKKAWLRAFSPLLSRVTFFHATSEEERRSIERVFGKKAPVVIVPNGTDLPPADYVEACRARSFGPPRIGFVGRIHPIKALEELIEAAALLRHRGVEFELRIAGPTQDRAYRQSLERRISEFSLGHRVHFEGELLGERKDAFYASCRILTLPSRSENFGNVVVEALAFGTPVVASLGTPWQHLEAVGAGRWVKNDPDSLADAIEPYLQNRELAEIAGEKGRRLVEERYTWRAAAKAMRDAYGEACMRLPSGPA